MLGGSITERSSSSIKMLRRGGQEGFVQRGSDTLHHPEPAGANRNHVPNIPVFVKVASNPVTPLDEWNRNYASYRNREFGSAGRLMS